MEWVNLYKNVTGSYICNINEICHPLFQNTDIDYFCYLKSFSNGSMLHLSSNPQWHDYYVDLEYYKISNFRNPPHFYKNDFVICSNMNNKAATIANSASENFHINHVITLIDKGKDGIEFYQFGTSRCNESIITFYLSNIEMLRLFIFYFKDKVQPIFKKIFKNKIFIPPLYQPIVAFNIDNSVNQLKKDLFIKTDKFFLDGIHNGVCLRKKDIECITLCAGGKTSKEIAIIQNNSYRTIEKRFEQIKTKLGCNKLSNVIQIVRDSGIILDESFCNINQKEE